MTRKELDAVAAKNDDEIAPLTVVELSALVAMLAQRDGAEQARHDQAADYADRLSRQDADHQEAIAVVKANSDKALTETVAPLREQVAALQAQLAEMQTYVDACRGTKTGQELARQAKRDALLKQKADVEAALVAMGE